MDLLKCHLLIIDVLLSRFDWIARHHTPALRVDVTESSMNEALVALEQLPGPLPPCQISY